MCHVHMIVFFRLTSVIRRSRACSAHCTSSEVRFTSDSFSIDWLFACALQLDHITHTYLYISCQISSYPLSSPPTNTEVNNTDDYNITIYLQLRYPSPKHSNLVQHINQWRPEVRSEVNVSITAILDINGQNWQDYLPPLPRRLGQVVLDL